MDYRGRSKGCYGNMRRLRQFHARRSNRAKRIDESLRAPLAKSAEQWLEEPNRFDIPDVDAPEKASQAEQDRRLEEIRQRQASQSPPPCGSLAQIRRSLAIHKLHGVTH